jgi:hypothetical protein
VSLLYCAGIKRAGVPVALGAAMFLPAVGKIAERHPGLKLIVDHMGATLLRGSATHSISRCGRVDAKCREIWISGG